MVEDKNLIYFNFKKETKAFAMIGQGENNYYKTKFTKEQWAELGINDTNADFEEVTE